MTKFLPVGIQSFEQMITGNFLYVDKTRFIHEMVRPPQGFYFLSRPRRFGKSLTVSTLNCLFQGRKELFDGLYISKTDWAWKAHPVILIDFNRIDFQTPDKLEKSLLLYLHRLGADTGIDNKSPSLPDCFAETVIRTAGKYGEKAVVLIDEYDKPIIDHLGKGKKHLKIAKDNREKLKQFFGVLKSGDVSDVLRFVFITGISKFARVSIFSDLNNLEDISMRESFGAFLGYTDHEIKTYFRGYVDTISEKSGFAKGYLMSDIRYWYDGYRFTDNETKVYNPFSVVNFMKTGKLKNYWFETATPAFLVNLIRETGYPAADIETLELTEEFFTVYDLDNLEIEPLLFQTGYITIRDFDGLFYKMGYPNQEVKTSFTSKLLRDLMETPAGKLPAEYRKLHRLLKNNDAEKFIGTVKSILASIPYGQIANQGESYYHSLFYLMLSASGVDARTEILTSRGRMDMAVEFTEKVFVIELKCDQSAELAIRQIVEKKYYEKYRASGKAVYLMGINFDTQKRTVGDWRCGKLDDYLRQSV